MSNGKVDVKRIQGLLAHLGCDPGGIDGIMGRRTAAAIRSFQDAEGLDIDGRVSLGLVAAMEQRAARPSATQSEDETAAVVNADTETDASTHLSADWRLGRGSLTGQSAIRFQDDLVTPSPGRRANRTSTSGRPSARR